MTADQVSKDEVPQNQVPQNQVPQNEVSNHEDPNHEVAQGAAGVPRKMVADLPDLIQPEEYPAYPEGGLVRLRLTSTAAGLEILGDAFRPEVLERLLRDLGPDEIEQMLCG